MGICHSCLTDSVATAKVILQDGKLQEFSYPVKVSYVLQRNPSCFICNSDEMEFDDFVSAINSEDELQLGQLYFALPISRLKYPLQAEEMAALAVKASIALRESGGCRRNSAVLPAVSHRREDGFLPEVGHSANGSGGSRRERNGNRRKFNAMLSAIQE
ncbi:HTH-type transcriptional regulator [Tasmannia lanceolata]|uniref:HTH-type transcriptional regulator n=1 Tax=Tasmannia lanceolata TaxID=3420 RepID=UPI004062F1EA